MKDHSLSRPSVALVTVALLAALPAAVSNRAFDGLATMAGTKPRRAVG